MLRTIFHRTFSLVVPTQVHYRFVRICLCLSVHKIHTPTSIMRVSPRILYLYNYLSLLATALLQLFQTIFTVYFLSRSSSIAVHPGSASAAPSVALGGGSCSGCHRLAPLRRDSFFLRRDNCRLLLRHSSAHYITLQGAESTRSTRGVRGTERNSRSSRSRA